MSATTTVSEAFLEVMHLAEAMGVRGLSKIPSCWEVQVSEGWWLAVNGHREPTKCSTGFEVPPFTAHVEWHGFPAGLFQPSGGVVAAGSEANEASLIEALQAKAREVREARRGLELQQTDLPLGGGGET